MRRITKAMAGCAVLVYLTSAAAAEDSKASRERELLRRAQEALRQSQQDNNSLAQGKADSDQKLKSAGQELDSLRSAGKSERAALKKRLEQAADAQTGLESQLAEARKQVAALTADGQERAKQLTARDSELKQLRTDLDKSHAATGACEAKNVQLYQYSQELVQRYHDKGVWTTLSRKEPVLGFGNVKEQNLLQEHQEKFDSQRLQPQPQSPQPAAPATK